MNANRVLLCELAIRTSARGNEYLAGFLGKAKLVGFKAKEPDRHGNEIWQIYACEPGPRQNGNDTRQRPTPAQNRRAVEVQAPMSTHCDDLNDEIPI